MSKTIDRVLVHADVEELQGQLLRFDNDAPPKRLWIVSNDAAMDRAVDRILNLEATLVLRRSLDEQLIEGEPGSEHSPGIDFAVETLGVSDLVICGHSQYAASFTDRQETACGAPDSQYQSLMQRIRQRERDNDRGRERVMRQVAALQEYSTVAQAMCVGRLTVHGVFYLVESAIFSRYDVGSKRFVPLHGR